MRILVVTCLLSISIVHGFTFGSPSKVTLTDTTSRKKRLSSFETLQEAFAQGLLIACLAIPQIAVAVSGGGLDYANLDITGQDFSNGQYKGKDFTQVRESNHSWALLLFYSHLAYTEPLAGFFR